MAPSSSHLTYLSSFWYFTTPHLPCYPHTFVTPLPLPFFPLSYLFLRFLLPFIYLPSSLTFFHCFNLFFILLNTAYYSTYVYRWYIDTHTFISSESPLRKVQMGGNIGTLFRINLYDNHKQSLCIYPHWIGFKIYKIYVSSLIHVNK